MIAILRRTQHLNSCAANWTGIMANWKKIIDKIKYLIWKSNDYHYIAGLPESYFIRNWLEIEKNIENNIFS